MADLTEKLCAASARMSGRVMLVDDEPSLLLVTGMMIGRAGIEHQSESEVGSALTAFEAAPHEYGALIMDGTIPGGEEAFARMRRLRPDLPVVLATGYGDLLQRPAFVRGPKPVILPKPFDLDGLLRALDAACLAVRAQAAQEN